jgi:hypothetical protein
LSIKASRYLSIYLCLINPVYGRIPDMNVGYARVSTGDQNFDLQRDALLAAGCDESKIFSDKLSGAKDDRPGLAQALEYVRGGDTLVGGLAFGTLKSELKDLHVDVLSDYSRYVPTKRMAWSALAS